MKSHARVVVIGGGVTGCSILYHLAKMGWKDVVVKDDPGGPPKLFIDGEARRISRKIGVKCAHLSLTRSGDYAAAIVLLEGGPRPGQDGGPPGTL